MNAFVFDALVLWSGWILAIVFGILWVTSLLKHFPEDDVSTLFDIARAPLSESLADQFRADHRPPSGMRDVEGA